MVEKFIRCRQCNQILPLDRFFSDCETPVSLPGVVWADEDTNFRRAFAFAHKNHLQEELRIDPATIFSEEPDIEPVKTTYFEATNGCKRFLIKRTKSGLEYPAKYEILPGRMEISAVAIKIQEADLWRQITADRPTSVLSSERVAEFVAAFREEVAAIPPHRLSEATAATAEGDSPQFVYAALNQNLWRKILDICARSFQPAELGWIREFIRNHGQPGEVLSLQVRRRISFFPEDSPLFANPEISALHP